jgi:hypothetical protein
MRRRFLKLLATGTVIFAAACAETPPARFFMLDSAPAPERPDPVQRPGAAVKVGTISLPLYLERSQVVTRTSPYRVDVSEFDRWAEPLDAMVPRILLENLENQLGPERLVPSNRRTPPSPAYSLDVTFSRMDIGSDGQVTVAARWDLIETGTDRVFLTRSPVITRQAADSGLEAAAAAMSQALALLAGEIAGGVASLPR